MPEYDKDMRIIRNHISKIPKTETGMSDLQIEWIAYTHQAASEILELIMTESLKLPEHISGTRVRETIDIIEDYIVEIELYHDMANSLQSKRLFAIKLVEAETIGCLFV